MGDDLAWEDDLFRDTGVPWQIIPHPLAQSASEPGSCKIFYDSLFSTLRLAVVWICEVSMCGQLQMYYKLQAWRDWQHFIVVHFSIVSLASCNFLVKTPISHQFRRVVRMILCPAIFSHSITDKLVKEIVLDTSASSCSYSHLKFYHEVFVYGVSRYLRGSLIYSIMHTDYEKCVHVHTTTSTGRYTDYSIMYADYEKCVHVHTTTSTGRYTNYSIMHADYEKCVHVHTTTSTGRYTDYSIMYADYEKCVHVHTTTSTGRYTDYSIMYADYEKCVHVHTTTSTGRYTNYSIMYADYEKCVHVHTTTSTGRVCILCKCK